MECRRVESADASIVILVCLSDSMTAYERLRFGLHCSSWFPRSLGVLLWRILHVLLIVLAPLLAALAAVAILVASALLDLLTVPIWLLFGVLLIAVCSTLMVPVLVCVAVGQLGSVLTRCVWAGDPWKSMLQIWRKYTRPVVDHFLLLREGCLSWKLLQDFRTHWPFRWFGRRLARWWEEVELVHDTIAI